MFESLVSRNCAVRHKIGVEFGNRPNARLRDGITVSAQGSPRVDSVTEISLFVQVESRKDSFSLLCAPAGIYICRCRSVGIPVVSAIRRSLSSPMTRVLSLK